MQCFDCHSERDRTRPGWPARSGAEGAGQSFGASGLIAPNITPDKNTGIGRWTDAELKRAIRDGIGRNGRRLKSVMPYDYFRNISSFDLSAVIAYLRTIKPINKRWSHSAVTTKIHVRLPTNIFIEKAQSMRTRTGAYLVTIAACNSCHTPSDHGTPLAGLEFAGGVRLGHLGASAVSTNITPSIWGIGYYDESIFRQAMRTGRVRGRKLSEVMPWAVFQGMTDDDLSAVLAFLRTLRPVDHKVNNQDDLTHCKRCGTLHGLGNAN